MKLYGFRHRESKTFSNGGGTPNFVKGGKFWTGPSAFKNHLNQAISANYGGHPTEVFFCQSFEPYLVSDLIVFDTESLTCEFDLNLMLDYFKKTCLTKYAKHKYPIERRTKELLGL